MHNRGYICIILYLQEHFTAIPVKYRSLKPARAHTAILLFTRTSAEEACVKSFCRGLNKSKAIASALISRTKMLVEQTGLPLVIIGSDKQQGNTFGERLQDAITQVWKRGYDSVICLGNDTPGLTPATLRAAADALQQHSFVFGKATDGGVYLMGMHRHTLPQLNLKAISWNTSLVFEELQQQTLSASTTILAPVLADADNAEDILSLSADYALGPLVIWLRTLLCFTKAPFIPSVSFSPLAIPAATGLRGPPVS
ncbi:DUF2064 domain-containing protein [Pontibacter korlensis]